MATPPAAGQGTSYSKARRIGQARVREISIVNKFPLGYRNREDITNLPSGVLVVGSQNVLTNVSERIQVRQGYSMDGQQAVYITGTAISANKVTLASTNSITTGDEITVYFTSGITGLTSGHVYYAIVDSSTLLGFATSNANAIAGTHITISGTPVGAKIGIVKSSIDAPIVSSTDWFSKNNGEIHMRAGFLTSAGDDGRLQFRWLDANGNVFWSDLLTDLTTVNYNFTTFWDTTELIRKVLFVNGTANIFEWSGAYDTVTAVTTDTIVVSNDIGTTGFYSASNLMVKVRGIEYTYTGITNKTFTGVSPDPTSETVNIPKAGDILYQSVVTTANSSLTNGPDSSFLNGIISTLNNQVFIGSLTSSTLWVSKINDYTDYSFTAGTRLPGEGATATLDANLVAFVPQEQDMYISAGTRFWYNTNFQQSTVYNGTAAITGETFQVQLIKDTPQQGAQSQGLVNKMKNYIVLVSNEPTLDKFGRLENILGTPQTDNISDPIKLDFDTYDFSYGSVFYWRYYVLVSVPKSGIVRIFNLATKSWEAPQTLPITRFYTVNGLLYGHSFNTSESYQLFVGYSDRATATQSGLPYHSIANFSYENFGTRTALKNANQFFIEGYISGNTSLSCVINYEQDGNLTQQTFTILGDDAAAIGSQNLSNSLGKSYLGQNGLGTMANTSLTGLPPKFRIIKTFTRYDFYECQFSFSILGVDQNFQLLSFGMNAAPSDTTNFSISE